MAAYSGKFTHSGAAGAVLNQGACQFCFDAGTAVLTPSTGTALAFDLGDVERATPGEWDFRLTLHTGECVELRQFGPPFSRMSEELLAAWRDRTVRCLLLEDLQEVARYRTAAAEIRLYQSNLAVLPLDGPPVQWRLADVDAVTFDEASYRVTLESRGQQLIIGKLARQTDDFRARLGQALDALHTRQAEALHAAFPFLDPGQLQRLLQAMPEGRSVPLATLRAIHPKLPDALLEQAIDEPLRPYFDALRARASGDWMAGFKFASVEPEDDGDGAEAAEAAAQPPLFFWFFFPLPNGRVAWEATTGTGRATYFLDAAAPVEQAVAQLTRGLALINFRREPVYLPDDSLELQPRYRRYAIGCRKLPDLRALRAAFRGRALHTSMEAWTAQVDAAR